MVGDRVRISKYKRKLFDKGHTPNWSEEVFVIVEIQRTNPSTYIIKIITMKLLKVVFMKMSYKKLIKIFIELIK